MNNPKMICTECGWRGLSDERLMVPNPHEKDSDIFVCSACKETGCFRVACDEDNCWQPVTCGTSTPGGYRSTCSRHKPREGE